MKLISFEQSSEPSNPEAKYEYWKNHLRRQRQNGLTLRQYSDIHQLSLGSLKYWSRKIKIEKNKLIPICLKPEPSSRISSAGLCTLILNDKYTLHIHDKETLFFILKEIGV